MEELQDIQSSLERRTRIQKNRLQNLTEKRKRLDAEIRAFRKFPDAAGLAVLSDQTTDQFRKDRNGTPGPRLWSRRPETSVAISLKRDERIRKVRLNAPEIVPEWDSSRGSYCNPLLLAHPGVNPGNRRRQGVHQSERG